MAVWCNQPKLPKSCRKMKLKKLGSCNDFGPNIQSGRNILPSMFIILYSYTRFYYIITFLIIMALRVGN